MSRLSQLWSIIGGHAPQDKLTHQDTLFDTPLLFFGKDDPWRIRDACEGTAIFGATGSGKTSGSGQAIAKSFLRAGFGGLVLAAKNDEADLWHRYCQETNRLGSLLVFSPQEKWRFNFLNYELCRPGVGAGLTENLVRLFTTIMQVAERSSGKQGGQDFWERTTKQMLRNCIDLVTISRGRLFLQEVYDVIISAPSVPGDVTDDAWQKSSVCWQCIREGQAKKKTARQEHDFMVAVKYWLREFPGLAQRTRSIIVTSLTSMLDIFLRGALRELFCTTTNVVPELTHEGAIIVLNLPVKEYAEVGQLAQILFKFIWQRATERRDVNRHGKFSFLWADEAQFFAVPQDAEFQSTARSARVATVYLTQNIGAYHHQLNQSETHSILGNLQTKLFHANGDPMTNHWAADLFSKSWQPRSTSTTSTSEGETGGPRHSKNYSSSDSLDFEVLPREFTSLKKGGPDHGWCVEAIAFQGGRVWNATQKNHIKVDFRQR